MDFKIREKYRQNYVFSDMENNDLKTIKVYFMYSKLEKEKEP